MLNIIFREILRLIQPVGLAWATLLILAILLWRMKRRGFAVLAAIMFVMITLVGSTCFPGTLLRRLERPWAGVKIADLAACDVVVVLGGGIEPSRHEVGSMHFTGSGDRIIMGLELMRLGKAPVIAFGGSEMDVGGRKIVEADLAKEWLESWHLPEVHEVVSLGANENTRQEGEKVARLAKARGWHRVLLVTSASHMERAVAVFHKLGVETVPAPCNFLTGADADPPLFRVTVPGGDGFDKLKVWIHEMVGWFVYKRRGWV